MSKKVTSRNPQDATLRNINALKKRVKVLEVAVRKLLKSCAVVALLPLVVCAETPNWSLYDQRIAPKAQEYKDRWTFGSHDAKLAATYYDAAKGMEFLARRYNDPSLSNSAFQALNYYADDYVIPANGVIPGYWIFTDGARRFNRGGVVNLLVQNGSYCMTNSASEPLYDTARSREVAYCLKAFLNAKAMGYQVDEARLFQLVSAAQSHLEQWAAGTAPYMRGFMFGLTSMSLIQYYEQEGELGIKDRLLAAAAYWKNCCWIESARAFRYTDRDVGNPDDLLPQPDLNLLQAPVYAWIGDKEFAGKVFNGGIEQAWLGNIDAIKQFNQQNYFTEEFQLWMTVTTPSPTPTALPTVIPTPTQVPTPSPSTMPSSMPSPSASETPTPTLLPTQTPTSVPTAQPTPCQRPTLMNSIKKLDKWTSCELNRLEGMIND